LIASHNYQHGHSQWSTLWCPTNFSRLNDPDIGFSGLLINDKQQLAVFLLGIAGAWVICTAAAGNNTGVKYIGFNLN